MGPPRTTLISGGIAGGTGLPRKFDPGRAPAPSLWARETTTLFTSKSAQCTPRRERGSISVRSSRWGRRGRSTARADRERRSKARTLGLPAHRPNFDVRTLERMPRGETSTEKAVGVERVEIVGRPASFSAPSVCDDPVPWRSRSRTIRVVAIAGERLWMGSFESRKE